MVERSVQDNKACGESSEGEKMIWWYVSRMHAEEKHQADDSSVLEPMDLKCPRSKQLFSLWNYRPVNPYVIGFHRPILFLSSPRDSENVCPLWMR